MTIHLYNTLSRRKEAFEPLDPPRVTIYNCGPTVYDRFHIGNARNFIFMDVVRRWLEYREYEVKFVQNLTDIDDKIINRANEEGIDCGQLTKRFIDAYFEDARKLGIGDASEHPRATEHIAEIVELIAALVEKGIAYEAGGSVYFSVRDYKPYGKLSGRRLEDLLEGARVEVSAEKRDPADFALWKAAKPGEPTWESPWGPGRPGWHIECSAMAMAHLGETIDIHAGGTDLTFPHHENELAQSEGATGKPFARYWMHNGFLNIDSEKMSKSLGNFLRVDQVLERHPVAAIRHFLLSAHYRSPLDLTEEALQNSASAVRRINEAITTTEKLLGYTVTDFEKYHPIHLVSGPMGLQHTFESAMDDDFNTPVAMSTMFLAIQHINDLRRSQEQFVSEVHNLVWFLKQVRHFFGLETQSHQTEGEVESLMQLLIDARMTARKKKAFDVADMIRDRLGELGIALEDHPQGTIWKRKE